MMNRTYLKTFLLFALLVSTTAMANNTANSTINVAGDVGTINLINNFSQVPGPNWTLTEDYYTDLFRRCTSIMTDLGRARDKATRELVTNTKTANQTMVNALNAAAAKLVSRQVTAAPHVTTAIIQANKISQFYWSLVKNSNMIGYDPNQQGFWGIINRLYNTVHYAYYEIDQKQFNNFVTVCLTNHYCYQQNFNPHLNFGEEYYQGIRRLTLQFLDVLVVSAPQAPLAADEFALSAVVANAAASVLNRSNYRLEHACEIVDLLNLSVEAEGMAKGNPNVPPEVDINYVRSSVGSVYESLQSQHSYSCHSW